jgi:hypothetical protein
MVEEKKEHEASGQAKNATHFSAAPISASPNIATAASMAAAWL